MQNELMYCTPGCKKNLDKSQCTSAIDSANNAVLSADFKNVIFTGLKRRTDSFGVPWAKPSLPFWQ